MTCLLIFGLGYTAGRIAVQARAAGFTVVATRRHAAADSLAFDDQTAVGHALAGATHILSSVPPGPDGTDPVLARYGGQLRAGPAGWIGYLSSTGVYGDTGGAWVDESAPIGTGRRDARSAADLGWQQLSERSHVFRLPGIYGPDRSQLNRLREGRASRIDLPGHMFSRIHVDDIVQAIMAAMRAPRPGVYNIADDEPAPGRMVTEYACDLLGLPYPPLQSLEQSGLSPAARAFYDECRRVANIKMKRDLGIRLRYPSYREGLRACLEEEAR